MEVDSGEPVIRLYADDPDAAARVLAIDLDAYDDLMAYPAGETDWPLERGKARFIQTALRMGLPWGDVVHATAPYFGELKLPPVAAANPFDTLPFKLSWDPLRQTPEQWKQAAIVACRARINEIYVEIRDYYRQAIQSGELRDFPRPRRATGLYTPGDDKLPIASESMRYTWAVLYFFGHYMGAPVTSAELAGVELQVLKVDKVTTTSAARKPWNVLAGLDAAKADALSRATRRRLEAEEDRASKHQPRERAATKEKRAEQIRTNVIDVLHILHLPVKLQE